MQAESCDNRVCDNRNRVAIGCMANDTHLPEPTAAVFTRLEALGLTQAQLAAELGLEPNKISKVRNGDRQFKVPELLRAQAWLTDQEGRATAQRRPHPDIPLTRSSEDDTVEISALDLSFSMGPGIEIDDYIEETTIRYDLALLRQLTRSSPDMLRLARGVGDSMFPTLHSSDRVLIDTTQRMLNLNDRIWAISLFGAAAIKRLRTIGPNRVLVISDNPDVPDQEVDAEDLRIGGRVISIAAREL